ncbi:MAG TPA: sarcosine oxidase subunit alpha family protein [Candidatus Thioglobus sp.]|jgi:sarcosine oxidase subunit alpha|nr:sarcosine oxidase subunit alpha family protein [Candidatus Thioglobus sp.]HIL42541.1 sarcosine oxidase subunit alpha family protein [Gammaproteobacteria bacterium]
MIQINRTNNGLIDQTKELSFTFNGELLKGYEGDTLSSALLANNKRLVGRSFKYHRPRGIFTAGSEEPNAIMEIGLGAYQDPNTRATVTKLYDGLVANSQNHRGPLWFDFMAITDMLSPLLGAGFYYKTFMWPKAFWEKIYEPAIRNSAGLGKLSKQEDPDTYDKGFRHCDILIIGAGASGLSAALVAGSSGAEVILADEDFLMGGRLNSETDEIDGIAGHEWAKNSVEKLKSMGNVRLMPNTTVFGAYDHGIYGAIEERSHESRANKEKPRQVNWRIYTKRTILCTGATERAIAFGNNDRPGIMLAGAVRTYLNRYAVRTGENISIYTNNDDGWRTARDLNDRGVNVVAIIDSRKTEPVINIEGVRVIINADVVNTKGRRALSSIKLSNGATIKTDTLAVSGGWNPNLHLTCHHRGVPRYSDDICSFVPGESVPDGMSVAGSANGTMVLSKAIEEGHNEGTEAARGLGYRVDYTEYAVTPQVEYNISAHWSVESGSNRAWVDLQNDVTAKDIKLANQEGFKSVEHVKRYTTLGMATDQGKTANVLAIGVMSENLGRTIEDTGTTIFRPPYSPVAIGAFAGRRRAKEFYPTRYSPSHKWADEKNAVFVEVGMWYRAQWFPEPGETFWRDSVDREVKQTRSSVGVCDVTTLGKIDIKGSDVSEFLNLIYANAFAKVPIGKTRYGLMLREDGMVMDDGTTARLSENHFVMTTTTANAVNVYRHMQFCHQCLWPDLDVHMISVTEQYAQYAVAGPNSRRLLQKIVDHEFDISNEAFPFMGASEITVCGGTPARLFRISFSGELAYEIAVQTRYGDSLMRAIMEAGNEFDVVAYGTEALGVMRIEKGHAAGPELNGQTSAYDLGMGGMISGKKDFIGYTLGLREDLQRDDRMQMVGFKPVNEQDLIQAGSHLVNLENEPTTENDQGWISSCIYSPILEHYIGLGFIKSGQNRKGDIVRAVNLLKGSDVKVEIVSPHFVDPEGERLRV